MSIGTPVRPVNTSTDNIGNISAASQPPSHSTKDHGKNLDAIVASYLKKKGYTRAAESLAQDAHLALDKLVAQANILSDLNITNYILLYNNNEKFPAAYDQSYHELREWIVTSLDQLKPELTSLLYPLFVHCYLGLVERGYTIAATKFMNKYIKEYEVENFDEIYQLAAVQSTEHLQHNELVALWRQNRYIVKMSCFSFELLMSFLQGRNFMTLIALINEHISIQTFVGYPQPQDAIERVNAYVPQDAIPDPNQKVYWGVTNELRRLYDKSEEQANDPIMAATTDQMDVVDESNAMKKFKRDILDKMVTEKKRVQENVKRARELEEAEKPKPGVPLPTLPKETEAEVLNDLRARVVLSSDSLPSICFYTLFNTYDHMTCSKISQDSCLVAAGFSDSSIKIWDLMRDKGSRWKAAEVKFRSTDGRDPKYNIEKDCNYSELIGHSQSVFSLDYSLDSQYLLSGSADGTCRLWSMETKTNVVCYRGHTHPIWHVGFAPIGYYFATASHDRTARLWSTSSLHPLRIFAGHVSDVNTVSFHPNCNYLFTGSSDKSLRLWDINSGNCVRVFLHHSAPIYTTHVSPDGRLAVSAGEDRTCIIWDLASGKRVTSLRGHEKAVWSVDISTDTNMLASGSADCTVRLWDLRMIADMNCDIKAEPVIASKETLLGSGALQSNKTNSAALGVYPTKSTPVHCVTFTRRNLLLASGPFLRPSCENE